MTTTSSSHGIAAKATISLSIDDMEFKRRQMAPRTQTNLGGLNPHRLSHWLKDGTEARSRFLWLVKPSTDGSREPWPLLHARQGRHHRNLDSFSSEVAVSHTTGKREREKKKKKKKKKKKQRGIGKT